ncbi:MAG: thioredoxin domain-containing protein [Patescibacteria group bacterium]|jgi:hypothetical protein
MSQDKKSLFELLDPKSALIVGAVGGLLTLGTLGFIILGYLTLTGKVNVGKTTDSNYVAANQPSQQQAQQPAQQQPAANVPKTAKPTVELFVMSYCPYGLQMEKAFLPAWNLLKDKADISIKYVSYAMHGQKEVEENTRQYCISKEQPAKYSAYLNCFFSAGQNDGQPANYKQCLTSAGVNVSALDSCYAKTDKQFGIMAKFNDKASWLSGQYPMFPINQTENAKYGVQGSPTLVINGVQSEAGRTPEAVKQAICAAFTNAPAECNTTLPGTSFQPGFGLSAAAGNTASAGCGT